MQKGLLILICSILYSHKVLNAQILWDGGGGDGLWATATNWVGDVVPLATDDVLLDNSIVITTYQVDLPGGAVSVSVNSLTITPNLPNTITLLLPNTNTSSAAFTATGTGDAVVLNNGSIFKNSSGATAGTPVSVLVSNFFRINNGGKYIHNTTRGHTDYLVSRLSSAPGTELGEFEFDVPISGAYAISMGNRIYGSLIFRGFSGDPTYTSNSVSNCNIRGNLSVYTNAFFINSMQGDIIVGGNFYSANNAYFDFQASSYNSVVKVAGDFFSEAVTESGSGFPIIEFNGTVEQDFYIGNPSSNNIVFRVNNPAGVKLLNSIKIPYQIDFTLGNFKTTATKLLIMDAGSFWTNASANSFVEGPLRKIGNTDFIFPVGVGTIYAPIGISGGTGSISDAFTAEYKRVNPQSIHGINYAPGLHHISYVEYWNLVQNAGTATKQVQLDVHLTSFCRVIENTYVSRWAGTIWTNEATSYTLLGTTGGYDFGSIKTNTALAFFGDFTLATDLDNIANPLPILLASINAVKINATTTSIEWTLTELCSKDARFEIQKSRDNSSFFSLITIPGNESSRFYNYNDTHLEKGITYYRLKMTDVDGKITYSKVVPVINEDKGLLITSLSPNPVANEAVLNISSAKSGTIQLAIYDLTGRVISQWTTRVQEGNNILNFNSTRLASGIYQLIVFSDEGKTTTRFMKQ